MCKLCAFAAQYSRARQDSPVFNLSQFATAITAKPVTEPFTPNPSPVGAVKAMSKTQFDVNLIKDDRLEMTGM
jgi:hypothetical protein